MDKSLSTLRGNIETYAGDASNVIWSETQKNLAVNLAIQSSWPELKKLTYTSFSLASASYAYDINGTAAIATATRAPMGPAQVWIATTATVDPVFRQLRRNVNAHVNGNTWRLEFDEDLVQNRGGYQVRVHFEQEYPELGSDSATTELPEAYLNPRALFHLCSMQALKGHHTDVAPFLKSKPDFYQEAADAKARHRTEALARVIRVRWE